MQHNTTNYCILITIIVIIITVYDQIIRELVKDTINKGQSWNWLTTANLKLETVALLTVCKEQAIATNYMKTEVTKSGNVPNCKLHLKQKEILKVCLFDSFQVKA